MLRDCSGKIRDRQVRHNSLNTHIPILTQGAVREAHGSQSTARSRVEDDSDADGEPGIGMAMTRDREYGGGMSRSDPPSVEMLVVPDARAWRAWLDEHEHASDGVWLMLAKKGVTTPTSLSYAEALDEALCSGWIDGQKKSFDAATFQQRFTPRRRRSIWSARNVDHIARLLEEGRMRPRGLAEVERAKEDGRWDAAYAGSASIEIPDDVAAALAANDAARETFGALTSTNRYAVLFRVTTARTAETRERRLSKLIEMLARGETPHPQ